MEALLLSHNSDESAMLRLALQRAGFFVKISMDFEKILTDWREIVVDLIVLTFPDHNLPISGIKQLRAFTPAPFIVIAEYKNEDAYVTLLDAGVDLVLLRPYSTRVFIAQVRALLRRASGVPFFSLPVLTKGDILLDPSERSVRIKERPPQRLTQLEFRLLYILIINTGQTISSDRLVEYVWGYSGKGNRDLVRGLIKRLRAKIETDSQNPRYILTVTGAGYTLKP
ncbi:MAG: response regulator transcription factor [Anaerolineales bacterium]|uniref:Response regulator transcription factor n=1 Tax=Candidatus Desulfolinea nitratireducens TaxID=2841698 RepID=A0A8J6NPD6_9CHLR|nr:response regulator transcription factor [Candidatus Desulfolinea nitratireducens]MBL6960299.1 response regulator transcription factor [Anaerolineales bacterium]